MDLNSFNALGKIRLHYFRIAYGIPLPTIKNEVV
jgi:hypothetical protein